MIIDSEGGYHFRDCVMRASIRASLDLYAETGQTLGDFLMCVLRNDLCAVFRADKDNRENLLAIVGYCSNELPPKCHGSVARVKEWQKLKAKQRKESVEALG